MATKIVIDPGHGGSDPGAVGFGLQEKNITLDIAYELRRLLANYADVTMTRTSDIFLSLSERAAAANRVGADLFISIHVNAGKGTGFESYTYTGASSSTAAVVKPIHEEVAAFYKKKGFTDRGQKKANFAVLRQTVMPAVLFENLFIDTQKDADKLKDPAFRKEIAGAIATGVIKSMKLEAATNQPATPDIPVETPPAWAQQAFDQIKEAGLVTSDHYFNDKVTWAELAAVLANLLDKIQK